MGLLYKEHTGLYMETSNKYRPNHSSQAILSAFNQFTKNNSNKSIEDLNSSDRQTSQMQNNNLKREIEIYEKL